MSVDKPNAARMFLPRSAEVAGSLLTRIRAEVDPLDSPDNPYAATNRDNRETCAPVPSEDELGTLLETAFQASLMNEEGIFVPFALAFVSLKGATANRMESLRFRKPIPLTASGVMKIASAGHPAHTLIGVERSKDGLVMWGLTHLGSRKLDTESDQVDANFLPLGPVCFFVRARHPAVLAAYYWQRLRLIYLRGVPLFQDGPSGLLALLRDQLGFPGAIAADLVELIARVASLGRGGTLLIGDETPVGLVSGHWMDPPSDLVSDARQKKEDAWSGSRLPNESEAQFVRRRAELTQRHDDALDALARLTRVDGAVVLNRALSILAFGTKIELSNKPQLILASPGSDAELQAAFDDVTPKTISIDEMTGGTRHRSAAGFCANQSQSGVALVASQDGDVSLFAKREDGLVVAIRPFLLGIGL